MKERYGEPPVAAAAAGQHSVGGGEEAAARDQATRSRVLAYSCSGDYTQGVRL